MSKILDVRVMDKNRDEYEYLCEHDCSNIIKKFEGRDISTEEFADALDLIITRLYRTHSNGIEVDIDIRNKALAPAKEMTIEEIERELGYKVKIVGEKE